MLDFVRIRQLLAEHGAALDHPVPGFRLGEVDLDFSRPHLVGVINLSTDSWYRESVCRTPAAAIDRGRRLLADGATFVDIGAESTLPDARVRTPEEQTDMLVPVVESLARAGGVVSVESYHPEVLEQCARAGARVFNLTGMRDADAVFEVAARYDAGVILCYIQGSTVRDVTDFELRDNMVAELLEYFRELLEKASRRGVTKCFVDPGLGFYYRNLQDSALRVRYQLETFINAFRMRELGKPVFNVLPHAPEAFGAEHRRAAEPFFAVLAAMGGTQVIRTHEVDRVQAVLKALQMHRP